MIYFIEAKGAGAVKIGYVNAHLAKRLAQLQCGCPHELVVIGKIEGTRRMEQKLHLEMVGHTVRGEWFEADAAKAVLARIRLVGFEKAVDELVERVTAIRDEVQRNTATTMARIAEIWPELWGIKRGRTEAFIEMLYTAPLSERAEVIELMRGSQLVALSKRRAA